METPSKQLPDEAIYVLVSFILIIMHIISLSGYVSIFVEPIGKPLMALSEDAGTSISDTFSAVGEIGSIRRERNDLLIENAILRAENSTVKFLLDEIGLLQVELQLSPDEEFRAETSVLSDGHETANEYLIVDKGSQEGILEGDIVRLGNIFIGKVDTVNKRTSMVDLPTSGERYWRVVVVSKDEKLLKTPVDELKLSDETTTESWPGVAIGKDTGIVVQNIPNSAAVKVGDYVFVNDADVGTVLYVGEVAAVDYDPAAVGVEVAVKLPVEYQYLTNLFVVRPGG